MTTKTPDIRKVVEKLIVVISKPETTQQTTQTTQTTQTPSNPNIEQKTQGS